MRMRPFYPQFFFVSVLVLLSSGCHSMLNGYKAHPTKTTETGSTLKPSTGLSYYLPKKLVKVTLTRTEVTSDALQKARTAATEASDAAKKAESAASAADAAATQAEALAKALQASTDTTAKSQAASEAIRRRAESDLAKVAADKAKNSADNLKRVADNLANQSGAETYQDDLVITELPAAPDTSRIFYAELSHWVTHEDALTLTTTESGLLTTTKGSSADKTGDIIIDTARLAKAIASLVTGLPLGVRALPTPPGGADTCPDLANPRRFSDKDWKRAFKAEYLIDPATFDPQGSINLELCKLNSPLFIGVTKLTVPQSPTLDTESEFHGLVYRRPASYQIEARERVTTIPAGTIPCPMGQSKCAIETQEIISHLVKAVELALPNGGPLAALSMETGWFVKTNYDIGFQDGMLTKLDVQRPSEVHAAIQIPLTIARELIALPTDLIQLKIDHSTKDASLVNAQSAILEAEKKKLDAEEALRKTRETLSQPPTSTDRK